LYEHVMKLTRNHPEKERSKILASFNFILIYPAKYEGVTLSEVLSLVWNKICSQTPEVKVELEKRLLQELCDMNDTCGTGLVGRLINVLSGFVQEEALQIKMNVKDQLRSNVFARLQANLRMLPESQQEAITLEMAESDGKKETVREFVEAYSVRDELATEFVAAGLIKQADFDMIYKKSVADFTGIRDEVEMTPLEGKASGKEEKTVTSS
jgi:hypothetical protein